MNTTLMADALITSPTAATVCAACEVTGTRHSETGRTFAHCPDCGTTNLFDTRSPWVVLEEAITNAEEPGLDVEIRWQRQDKVSEVREIARRVAPDHCGECAEAVARLRRGADERLRAI